MKYFIEYGLNERIEFKELDQATIFTLGLMFKGISYTMGQIK